MIIEITMVVTLIDDVLQDMWLTNRIQLLKISKYYNVGFFLQTFYTVYIFPL